MNHIEIAYRIENARKALLGVSIGDAFGDSFFGDLEQVLGNIYLRQIPETKWEFTDDTVMSIAVFEELERNGGIDQENLIKQFCINHDLDANRGYGATLRRLLREVQNGESWQEVSKKAFEGQGSMGNGAAMRVCPIGAFHFDDFQKVKELAVKSAEITHSNIEAITGAVAVAIGTALTAKMKFDRSILTPIDFIDKILNELPDSDTKSKISKSKSVPYNYNIETVKSILGNGVNMTAQDTVPFAIWCTAYNLQNFEEGLWKAVSILGDRDTICAIVGGMSILSSEDLNIPQLWVNSVESFEKSVFRRK